MINSVVRVASSNVVVKFRPGLHLPASAGTHIQKLIFDTSVTAGSYKLWVNGEITSQINFTTGGSTHANAIDTALDNLAAAFTVTVNKISDYEFDITVSPSNTFLHFEVVDMNLTGGKMFSKIKSYGGETFTLSAAASSAEVFDEVETQDKTTIGQFHRSSFVTAQNGSVRIDLFDAKDTWEYALYPGNEGLLLIYEEGEVIDTKMVGVYVIIRTYTKSYPRQGVYEISIECDKQGAYAYPPGTLYKG